MSYFDSAIYNANELTEIVQAPILGTINSFKSVEQQKQEKIENVYAIVFVISYFLFNYFVFYIL